MTATLLHQATRPDGRHTHLRGNLQHLPSGNLFGAWSKNLYISEHTSEGEVVYEASFTSRRFVLYRAYKFNFTARPIESPVIGAFASVTARREFTTVVYASWNGATDVHEWRNHSADDSVPLGKLIGSARRSGFETAIVCKGFHPAVYAEAVNVDGESLGMSSSVKTELPHR